MFRKVSVKTQNTKDIIAFTLSDTVLLSYLIDQRGS